MRRRRWLLLVAFYGALIGGGWLVGQWLTEFVNFDIRPLNEPTVHRMVMSATGIYIAASAIPFVPGAEIGFTLLLVLGNRIVFLVYAAMVAALLLAFLVGRLVPPRVIAATFVFFGLRKARDLVLQMEPLDGQERLALLTARAPTRIVPLLLQHRYLALAVILNLPGNTLIGGGGGIALVAGMSGLYSALGYIITVALAVAPIPVLILVFGYQPAG